MSRALPIALSLLFLACEADSAATSNVASQTAAAQFSGGTFDVFVTRVEDQCLDGALDLLFMPDGTQEAYALKNPIVFPASASLPAPMELLLAAPFTPVTVTMLPTGSGMEVSDVPQVGVLLDVPGSDDCRADISLDATVAVQSNDAVQIVTQATLSNFTSPTDTCPPVSQEPCDALLQMAGTRR